MIGLGCALTAGIVMGFCAVTTRALKETPTPVIVFYHTVGGLTLTAAYILIEMLATGNPSRFTEYTAR